MLLPEYMHEEYKQAFSNRKAIFEPADNVETTTKVPKQFLRHINIDKLCLHQHLLHSRQDADKPTASNAARGKLW